MRVGLPEELLAFEWVAQLKIDLERSLPSIRWLHAAGKGRDTDSRRIMLSEGDACFPFKKMVRTSLGLMEQVDALLLPRLVRLDGHLMCPNFRGLPDIVALNRDRIGACGRDVVLVDTVVDIGSRKQHAAVTKQIVRRLTREAAGAKEGKADPAPAFVKQEDAPAAPRPSRVRPVATPRGTIALLGHPYILADPQLNMGVPEMLRRWGFAVATPQDIPFAELDELAASQDYYAKTQYWRGARECLGAFLHFTQRCKPVGIIYLISFNCGVDALVRIELMSLYKQMERKIPFMVLVGDEHTQQEHTVTRLEAFLDIVYGITGN